MAIVRMREWVIFLIDAQLEAVPPLRARGTCHLLLQVVEHLQYLITVLKDEECLGRADSVASSNHLFPHLYS